MHAKTNKTTKLSKSIIAFSSSNFSIITFFKAVFVSFSVVSLALLPAGCTLKKQQSVQSSQSAQPGQPGQSIKSGQQVESALSSEQLETQQQQIDRSKQASQTEQGQRQAQQKIQDLKVCSELAFVPFEMKRKDGTAYGFEIDILSAFAKKYNYRIVFVEVPWTSAIPTILSKKCDLIASGMASTPERDKLVNFTMPTHKIVDQFLYKNKPELKNKFKTLESFNAPGVKIGLRQSTEMSIFIKNNYKKATILEYPYSDADVINALTEGKVTAIALHSPTAAAVKATHPGKIIVFPTPIPTQSLEISFAIRKDEIGNKIQQEFNTFFTEFKETNVFKEIDTIYFGD